MGGSRVKLRVFTLRFDPARGAFDDEELRAFLDTAEVIERQTHFFQHEQAPWLAIVVAYRPCEPAPRSATAQRRAEVERAHDRREELTRRLDEVERRRFDALRAWRATRARADGVPIYLVLTNRQLAAIAQAFPRSKPELGAIDGVGEGKLRAFGDEVLAALASVGEITP